MIVRRLGRGGFGEVYIVSQVCTGQVAVAKIPHRDRGVREIMRETHIYSKLGERNMRGFPRLVDTAIYQRRPVIILQKMGWDISEIKRRFTHQILPHDWVLEIGKNVILLLSKLHSIGFIHCDIKPGNIVVMKNSKLMRLSLSRNVVISWIGKMMKKHHFSLLDFGLSERLFDDSGTHVAPGRRRRGAGTTYFASVAYHDGEQRSRKDDLESLMYVLVYLQLGNLPWNDAEMYGTLSREKRNFRSSTHFTRLPESMKRLVSYVWELEFMERPNYEQMIGMMS